MIFFTADTHFGHANIIKYCDRPFANERAMDREIIRRWNDAVRENDIVYHLGDFTLRDSDGFRSYISQLNGSIHILGNPWHHDRRWLKDYNLGDEARYGTYAGIYSASGRTVTIEPPVVVQELREYKEGSHPKALVLCHYPFVAWDRSHYGSWHLHGHCHGKHSKKGKIMDVGVDSNDFRPVSLGEVAARMKKINEKVAEGTRRK